MLIVRFRETFRDRQMEWALTAGATGWGLILVRNPEVFTRPFYAPLANMASSDGWGWAMFMLGLLGLIVLFINGAWRRTPLFRQVASIGRMFAWFALFFGCVSAAGQSPAAMIYAMIACMEAMALSNATADGLKADAGIPVYGR
jgi:hypothetical protein